MERPDWAPEGVDLERPSVARAYDYWLGGSHNFEVDRQFARQALAAVPDLRMVARANREFLHRAVGYLLDIGIRQFLDIGSGIPTVGNVHEIAQQRVPDARVVYVDIDPVAVAHSEQILAGNGFATAIQEDLRHPEAILDHPATRALLDFREPIGLLLASVLHAIPDADDPHGIVTRLLAPFAPGSCLVVSHVTTDSRPRDIGAGVRLSARSTTPVTARRRDQVERFFVGLDLVAPGVVWSPLWRPESPGDVGEHPERMSFYVGVGRKA